MAERNEYVLHHNHSYYSNLRLTDAITSPRQLIETAKQYGYKGMSITEHESLSSAVDMIKTVKEMKASGELREDFRMLLGNEIYLVDSLEEVRDNYESGKTKFPHFCLIAKNRKGFEALSKLSTQAWKNSFFSSSIMERVPTEKAYLREVAKSDEYKGTLMASSACFIEGTKVKTKDGLKSIERIKKGEKVLTHKNRWKKVVTPTTRLYQGNFVELDTSHGGRKVTTTENHKFLVLGDKIKNNLNEDRFKDIHKNISGLTHSKKYLLKQLCYEYETKWVEAKDLTKEDYTLQPLNEIEEDILFLDLSRYNSPNYKYQLPDNLEVDDMFLRFIGMFISEGSFNFDKYKKCNGINFTLNIRDKHLLDDIVPVINRLGLHAYVSFREEHNRVDVSTSSVAFGSFMYNLFSNKSGALNKHIPTIFKNLPKERLLHLIKGLFITDGYARERKRNNGIITYEVNFTSISPTLTDDVVEISQKLGMNPSVCMQEAKVDKNNVNHQEAYYIYYSHKKAKCLKDFIWHGKEFIYNYSHMNYPDFYIESNGVKYFRKKIKKVNKFYDERQVYCLNVEDDHSFIAHNHIVHNCLGSPVNIYLQEKMLMEQTFDKQKIQEAHDKAKNEVQWCVDTFGKDDFYIELQPADTPVQRYVNENLLDFAKEFGLKYIVACDTHYANKTHATVHAAFLNSKNEEREVEEFYKYTYMHSVDDIYKQMAYYLGEDVVKKALETTTELYDKSEDYDLAHSPIIPRAEIPEFELKHLFKPAYDKYKSLERLAYSDKKDERYMLHLLEEGYLRELHKEDITKEEFHEILARLDVEMEEILGVGDKINQTVSSYYITVRDIINTIWEEDTCNGYSGSLVGSGRGSSGGFLSLFLLGITQVNPLEHKNMPHFRHLHKSREDFPDVDVDIESKRRQEVIRALKNKYGEDKVLNVATFTTAGTKSCIKIAARGLGIEDTEAQYIASLIPTERGQQYTLSDCLYGNEEKGRKKQQQFINEMEKYPELLKTALGLESIVVAKSQHAGGVIIFNDEIHKHSAMMKAAKGEASITQWSLKDSEYMGLVKFDLLSIDNLDRIRSALELMEKDGVIESKGSLKETFNEYLHPRVLNHEDKRYYELASKGIVNDTFQFNTNIGIETLKRIKPENFEQFSAANSLMRLQSQEGKEPPMDIFIKHKKNIQTWYDEMNEWGLTDSEIKVMEEHIGHTLGVSPVQEQAMGLSGDPRIANFTVEEQNKLRKAIAKPKGAALDEIKLLFYRKGEEQGTSKNLLDYVWETQFTPMFSYAFSSIHSNLYSIIGIQNLHLNLFYNPIYWQTACLNVDSGATSENSEFLVDHEKIANGIGKIKEFGVEVKLPDINKSDFAFTPDAEHNVIIYGLKPVKSLNSKTTHHIIENRPYNSIKDVFTKLYDNKLVTNTQLINMVKSGMLDNICESRKVAMMEVIKHITKVPETLTMQNIKTLIESGILEGRPEEEMVLFRESFKNKVVRKEKQGKSNVKIFKVEDMELYDKLFGSTGVVNVTSNYYEVDEKQFKKVFDKKIKDLKEWLKSDEQLKKVHSYELNKQWIKYALGSYSKWEMETLSFYYHEHELSQVDSKMYNLSRYNELPEEPQVVDTFMFKGREFPKYKIDSIAGVVISKNATKNMVTIIATDGSVVPIKYQGNFSYYNKAVKRNGKIVEDSWFGKGNLLIVSGFRRGNQFVAKRYADSNTSTTTKLIDYVGKNGEVTFKLEREYI